MSVMECSSDDVYELTVDVVEGYKRIPGAGQLFICIGGLTDNCGGVNLMDRSGEFLQQSVVVDVDCCTPGKDGRECHSMLMRFGV